MIHEVDISRSLPVESHKILVAGWPLLLCVAREHALQTDAYALDVVHRRPALSVEQVEADDAIGVYVWVPGNRVRIVPYKDNFGGLQRVLAMRIYSIVAEGWEKRGRTSIG